ncbi:hypothetical protein EJ07DRAFT_185072 [Lizonia empirigonia]|nr:hypothetical protein EJ07DRAFT_185072 [Lizonia empirigonia]
MPPTARLATVEFRWLLLPPIRVSFRTLHAFARPPCRPVAPHARPAATCLSQCRPLHLWVTAKAKTVVGMQKILAFDRYEQEPPSASDHRVTLVRSETDLRPLTEGVSLQELYDHHIGPGKFLYSAQPVPKTLAQDYEKMREYDVPSQANKYAILPAHTLPIHVKNPQIDGKQFGPLKNVHISLPNPIEYTKGALDRAYQFIELGLPVEFRMRLSGKKKKGTAPPDPAVWPWMHAHFPHLRPDFILKSMPERSEYLIHPVTDGRVVQFVVGRQPAQMPGPDLTQRVFRVKEAVLESMGMPSIGVKTLNKVGRLKKERVKERGERETRVVHEQNQAV